MIHICPCHVQTNDGPFVFVFYFCSHYFLCCLKWTKKLKFHYFKKKLFIFLKKVIVFVHFFSISTCIKWSSNISLEIQLCYKLEKSSFDVLDIDRKLIYSQKHLNVVNSIPSFFPMKCSQPSWPTIVKPICWRCLHGEKEASRRIYCFHYAYCWDLLNGLMIWIHQIFLFFSKLKAFK